MSRIIAAFAACLLITIAAPAGASAHAPRGATHGHRHGRGHRRHHAVRRRRHRRRRRHGHKHHSKQTVVEHAVTPHSRSPARGADTNGCANTNLTPSPENLETVREATLCLINRERVTRGEQPLKLNAKLQDAAQGHSESMASDDYFSHEGPGGSTPVSRMRAVGYIYSSKVGFEVGENIAWGTLWLATPKAIVEGWMASPEHRENILDSNYRDTAIGVSPHPPAARAEGQAGAIYTQDFGVIITS